MLNREFVPANAGRSPNRLTYIALIVATVATGLATRRFGAFLPPFIAAYAPDALWALMVFWIVRLLWPRGATLQVALTALAFSYTIEISQLLHPAWLDAIRHTRLGGLVLGFGFLWSDIACYTVGVGMGILMDRRLARIGKRPTRPLRDAKVAQERSVEER